MSAVEAPDTIVSEFSHYVDERIQMPDEKIVNENFYENENILCKCKEPERRTQTVLREKVVSTFLKIIIFTDTILTSIVPKFLSTFFASVNIDVSEHLKEECFFQNISQDQLATHFVVIKTKRNVGQLLNIIHRHTNVHAIYLQCDSDERKYQRRLARYYSKVNTVLDDSLRLLIGLIMDIALFCEESADRQKEKELLAEAVQENYQRSIDLCAFTEKLMSPNIV